MFGIQNANETNTLFYPLVGMKNMMTGLAILTLNSQGDRKAVAVVVGCCALAGLYDVWFCMRHDGRWAQHAMGTPIFVSVCWALW